MGLFAAGNRPGPGPAEQIRGAARRRRDAGRNAVRHAGRQSASPKPIDVPETAAGQIVWLSMPVAAPNTREVDDAQAESASRYHRRRRNLHRFHVAAAHRGGDRRRLSAAGLRTAQDREARLYRAWHRARLLEVRDKKIIFDEKYVPPVLVCRRIPSSRAGSTASIGWIENKLEELARYAADPTSGGGLQSVDYFVLQLLNRHIPVLKHFSSSSYVHPERLFEELLRLAGELATFATPERRARDYPRYDHDDLENVFAPVMRDLQDFLSARLGRRAIRLEIIERAQNAFVSPIRDRSLFRNATFVLEVAARRPLIEIQNEFPHLFKVGPNTKMNEIVHANLPGVPLVHLPTPPPQIRAITDHVYFYLDRKSPLWPEFSDAASIGMHFSGDWPELELELWAILEDRR